MEIVFLNAIKEGRITLYSHQGERWNLEMVQGLQDIIAKPGVVPEPVR